MLIIICQMLYTQSLISSLCHPQCYYHPLYEDEETEAQRDQENSPAESWGWGGGVQEILSKVVF